MNPKTGNGSDWCAFQIGRYTSKERHKAMAKGIKAVGGEYIGVMNPQPDYIRQLAEKRTVLFAFTSGMHKADRTARETLQSLKIPLIVLDLGYFKRAKNARDVSGYNQAGIGKIGWTPPLACPPDRWKSLAIPDAAEPRRSNNRTVLVLGQCANDSQHHMKAEQLHAWFSEKTAPFMADGWRIVYRPHPMERAPEPAATWAHETRTNEKQNLADALSSCGQVVTFNSTAGLDAILAGIPVVCSPMAHYADIAFYGHHLSQVTKDQVMSYMYRLAYSQWTCPELERGAPIRFLANFLV